MTHFDAPPGTGRIHPGIRLSGALLLAVVAYSNPIAADNQAPDNRACLRCHAMATLAFRDQTSGDIVDLSIAPPLLRHSVHGQLECVECHDEGFRRYPHPDSAAQQKLDCVNCHEEKQDAEERAYRFETIATEYGHSVHATSDAPEVEDFNCHSCHDPHRFQKSDIGKPISAIVRDDNRVCLSCHAEQLDPLLNRHAWLPNRAKHWEAVRCLDCHTPLSSEGQPVSHQILSAKDSNHDCVNCHSREPRLLNRLYRYRAEVDRASQGWLTSAVFNEAYIVGMSRNPTLDRLGLIVIGLTVLGLAAHGFGRFKAHQRAHGGQK